LGAAAFGAGAAAFGAGAAFGAFGAGAAFTFFGASFLGFAAGNAGADSFGCSINLAVSVPSNRDFDLAVCPFAAYIASRSNPSAAACDGNTGPDKVAIAAANTATFCAEEEEEDALHACLDARCLCYFY